MRSSKVTCLFLLTLWGFVTYMFLYYIDFILLYNLQGGNYRLFKMVTGSGENNMESRLVHSVFRAWPQKLHV
jgi:hypothetical protein